MLDNDFARLYDAKMEQRLLIKRLKGILIDFQRGLCLD